MKVGMYTEELKRPNVSSLFETIHTFGFQCVQWDFLSVCDDEMPEYVPEWKIEEICTVARKQHIEFAALTGTFNMAHPDCTVRENGLCRLQYMADLAPIFHCDLLTLCCGSRANDMWTIHPDNDTPEAWRDLLWTMERAVVIAEERNLKLGIEIEASNVVHTPAQARKLFDEIQSSCLGLILDGANLFPHGLFTKEAVRMMLDETFDLLGDRIVLAHGKDLKHSADIEFTYAGNGIMDFPYFMELLRKGAYSGPLILHGMCEEAEFTKAVENISLFFPEWEKECTYEE